MSVRCVFVGIAFSVLPMNGQMFPPPLRETTQPFAWSGYVQVRYTTLHDRDDMLGLRRFKLMVGGLVSPRLQWYAQGLFKDGNESPTDGRAYFQEGWLRFTGSPAVNISIGQFKPPFGLERFTPDFEILTIDRSAVIDALSPDGSYVDSEVFSWTAQ
jgi:phosphate-selective porin